jgi:hypothetical protein
LNKNIGSSNHFLSNSKIIRNQAKRQWISDPVSESMSWNIIRFKI